MTIRATILKAVQEISTQQKIAKVSKILVTTRQVQEHLGISDSRISSLLYSYDKEKYLKKIKLGGGVGGGGNAYQMLTRGTTEVKNFGGNAWGKHQVQEWSNNGPAKLGAAKAPPVRNYGAQVMGALEGITDLVDQNEKYRMGLISLRTQIDQLLMDGSGEDGHTNTDTE